MRIAIISDIHANIDALDRALDIIGERSIDEIICLGDTVGYGASPNECLARIREAAQVVLLGNHDAAALDPALTEHFNAAARAAAIWTSRELTAEHRAYLAERPYSHLRENLLFVHASPAEPEEWHYVLSPADAHANFPHFTQEICFVGHSHAPAVFCEDLWTRRVERGKRFIINVGSVGQPRDHDPRLSFGIFDTETWEYENVRAGYDVAAAAARIRAAGLPPMLGERLLEGR